MKANTNDNTEVCKSQTSRILSYLLEGHSLTPIEALQKFGTFRLGARIKDIEKQLGYAPRRDRVKVRNAEGKDVYVARYWIG